MKLVGQLDEIVLNLAHEARNPMIRIHQRVKLDHYIADNIVVSHRHLLEMFCFRMVNFYLIYKSRYTERIACILCMHLGACRFFTHPTALVHIKK